MSATFLDYCQQAGADVAVVRRSDESREALRKRWYASLHTGSPDYGIYDTDEYLAEAWHCWRTYSSRYLKLIRRSGLSARLRPRVVVDLGCGIGWSTAVLAKMFPDAAVIGTNLLTSTQTKVARLIAQDQAIAFDIVEDPAAIGHADLVFASEYFEHFPAPIDHLRDIEAALTPAVLLTASTFTQPSAGHFDSYQVDTVAIRGTGISRRFNAELRSIGYTRMPITFWNDRPACWQQEERP